MRAFGPLFCTWSENDSNISRDVQSRGANAKAASCWTCSISNEVPGAAKPEAGDPMMKGSSINLPPVNGSTAPIALMCCWRAVFTKKLS